MATIDWDAYIDRASTIAFDAEDLWKKIAPQSIETDDYVRRAVYSLRVALLVDYHAVLTLLREPMVAYAGEGVLRGGLEALAHLAWIAHGEPASNRTGKRLRNKRKTDHCLSNNRESWSNPHTRALCWLMSDSRWFHRNVAAAHRSVKDPRTTRQARRRMQKMAKLHKATGCPGKRGRDQTDVEPMLMLLARHFKLWWLPDLWRAYSATAHQAVPRRLASESVSGPVQWGGPLPNRELRSLLIRNVTLFLNAYQHVLMLSAATVDVPVEFTPIAQQAMDLNRELGALRL